MSDFWKEQMSHPQTKAYYDKLKELINSRDNTINIVDRMIQNGEVSCVVLEIGLDVGISARAFLEFPGIKLTSVDSGDVQQGIKEIEELGFKDRWTFHHISSDRYFSDCKRKFDLIYIDGDHSYEQTKKDINNAWRFISPGGILIGHDIIHKGNFKNNPDYGVNRAFAEFIDENNVEATIYPPHPGLIVIRK